jgi:hypothetical protein
MWPFSSRKVRRTAQSFRPFLEMLEDRSVPATLSYSSYLQASVFATAVDSAGNVYVTGHTDSNLPTTPGAFQTTGSGAFVAKLNATGTALLYATYLGTTYSGTGIAVDAAGDAFVMGAGGNVPTTPNAISATGNVFVAELNPTGTGLIYSTYLPGAVSSASDTLSASGAIALDGSGNIYVAGAAIAGLPVTAGAYQTACLASSGAPNAFFAKINPTLSGTASLVYASYLGGTSSVGDAAMGIALDGSGNAYVEGYTTSNNFPTTSGALQRASAGGLWGDDFVAKFNPALSGAASLVYSTYLGGSGSEYVPAKPNVVELYVPSGGIAVDSDGNAYVTGATTSTNFPIQSGSYQVNSNIVNTPNNRTNYPPSDAFVTKLNATGSALVYSTYLGGGTNTVVTSGGKHGGTTTVTTGTYSGGTSIAVDANGDAHVVGWTNSMVFPTVNALQPTKGSGLDVYGLPNWDAFVTVFNASGSGLLFSSYFAGTSQDWVFGIALDSAGNAYVGGQTRSTDFPTTPGAYQTTPGSGFVQGGFVLKIDPPADVSEVSVPISANGEIAARDLPSEPESSSFTASPNSATADSGVMLAAAEMSLANPNSIIGQTAFYVQSNGTDTLLSQGTQTSPAAWTFTFTVNLAPGPDTLSALARDSDAVLGDPVLVNLKVI